MRFLVHGNACPKKGLRVLIGSFWSLGFGLLVLLSLMRCGYSCFFRVFNGVGYSRVFLTFFSGFSVGFLEFSRVS